MTKQKTNPIEVTVKARFLDDQSSPPDNRYVFAYAVQIRNVGSSAAKLVSRHWVITDANGKIQEVRGEGVVGEQPWIRPGEDYQYTSGAIIESAIGTMRGSYQMVGEDGARFEAPIAEFTLSVPRTLH